MKNIFIGLCVSLLTTSFNAYSGENYIDEIKVQNKDKSSVTLIGDIVVFDSQGKPKVICSFNKPVTPEVVAQTSCPTVIEAANSLSFNHGFGKTKKVTYYAALLADIDWDGNTTIYRTVYAKDEAGVTTVKPQQKKFFVQTGRFVIHPSEAR